MKIEFKSSFERSIKALSPKNKEDIKEIATTLIDILENDKPLHQGIGLKRLRNAYWEVRKGIRTRLLFRWQGDLVEFVLAGNHDDIKDYLKTV